MIIDQLPLINDVQGTDEFAVERGTTTYKGKVQQILDLTPPATATPLMDGTAAVGGSAKYAREDHVHPSDTSKQDTLVSGTNIKTVGGQSLLGSGNIDAGGALSFTVTLLAANWSSNQQTVLNANFIASGYAYIVSPASASFAAYGEAQIYADNVTADGSMTFHCDSAPSSDLTVNVVRVVSA